MQLSIINLPQPDSLERLLTSKVKPDTSKVNFLGRLSYTFTFNQADKAVLYAREGIKLAQQLRYKEGLAYCTQSLSMGLWAAGNYSNALQEGLTALHLYQELKDWKNIGLTHYVLANIFRDFGDYKRALIEVQKGFEIYERLGTSDIVGYAITGSIYDLQNQLDSASFHVGKAVQLDKKLNKGGWGWLYFLQGNIHRKRKQYDSAQHYYRAALPLVRNKDIVETYNGMAILYAENGKLDSTIFYATEVVEKWRFVSYQRGILQAANILADAYKRNNQRDSAIKYLELSVAMNSNMFNQENERDIQNIAFNEQIRQDEILEQEEKFQSRLIMYALIASGLVFLIITIFLWRNNAEKQKAKEKIEQAYSELKATQQQLIQSEKMASLGELTAGIAHEIQNPLNFVNNFSEVNSELLMEMKLEIENGNIKKAKSIAADILENEHKIVDHGKRAAGIVKGMLQHSRTSTGVKEPTSINELADEYLRLAFHGFKAKDKTFNATIHTDYDRAMGAISIIRQDIGRVILNLITNAFYSVTQKKMISGRDYEPKVSVSTKSLTGKIKITVRDNGIGVPSNVLDKIFQPFFTTKPAGHGTGLGLSLSYDIIKSHGGELTVKTREGEFAEFNIELPA